jgi:hypothetical protein
MIETAVLWLCLALFPIAGVLVLVAGMRGMWTGRVDWFGGRRLSGAGAVIASLFMVAVGAVVLFLSCCYFLL